MNNITQRQLLPAMLSLVRARTLAYRRAKRCQAFVLALNLLLPVVSAAAAVFMPDARPAIAVCALLLEPPRDSWRPVGVSQADVADSAS